MATTFGVLRFPGSNCDDDTVHVVDRVMREHGSRGRIIWHKDQSLGDIDALLVPGGFSYGDYLRAGAMAAKSPVMREIIRRAGKGVPVLGICNGFQVLTESGLLPGALMRNANLKYVCKDVHLKVEATDTPFTQGYGNGGVLRIPVAHHDGNYFADDGLLDELEDNDQIAFRYSDGGGKLTEDANPNGSRRNIAGILNQERNVLGMMPHPERLADPALGGTDGKAMFSGLVEALS